MKTLKLRSAQWRLASSILVCLFVALVIGGTPHQTLLAQAPGNKAPHQYIGLKYGPRLPAGLRDLGGAMISHPYQDQVEYTVHHVRKGAVNMLWLEVITHRNAEGLPFARVLDVLTFSLARNQQILFVDCTLNGTADPEIMAIVDNPPRGSYVGRTRQAWRASRLSNKFEKLPIKGVRCEIPGD